ncbi:peroxide stress protein YaaA [soil metagenome]
MLLVLPPSETKRDGGAEGSALDLGVLGFPELTAYRRATVAALTALSRNVGASNAALRLGPTQRFGIDRNRRVTSAPVLPAMDRYTGVLYDGLAVDTLTPAERSFAAEHVAIQSALFGLLRAGDLIPAYRLSHDSRLPGLSLRRHWAAPVAEVLARRAGVVLDLRSEAYAALGPRPTDSLYLRVLSEGSDGRRVALSHFNKKSKGEFTRELIASGIDHGSVDSLIDWARARGIRLEPGAPGEIDLVV